MALPNIIQQINSKLPLSGGTLTGSIGINSGQTINFGRNNNITGCFITHSQSSNGASEMAIHSCSTGDSPYTGACIYLHTDKDSRVGIGGEEAGGFSIAARKVVDGTNIECAFQGYPNGNLYWGGYNVITSKGGSITGNLAVSNMYCNKLNTSVTWGVGTTWNDAPSISLYGPNETSSGIPDCFSIRAGANKYALTGKPDGNLYWGGSKVLTEADKTTITQWGLPNYNGIISGIGSTYTAPYNGFVSFNKGGTSNATVNGITVYLGGNDAYNEGNVTLYLKKGDTIVMGVDVGTICFVPLYHGG